MSTPLIHYTPILSIAPSYAIEFFKIDSDINYQKPSNRFNLLTVSNSDTFSKNSQKKLKNYIDWFVEQSLNKVVISKKNNIRKFYKLNMITLTLPFEQHHSDQIIKQQLLNQFFIEAKKKWNMFNYIWRAEKQHNGNIHFHIVSDVFIPWQECRNIWNRICDKLDLVKLYTAKMKERFEFGFNITPEELKKYSVSVLKKRFRAGKKTGWTDPNSIDIHALYKINNISAYLTEYLVKKENEDLQEFVPAKNAPSEIIERLEKQKQEYLSKMQVAGRNWYVSDNIRNYCKNIQIKIIPIIQKLCNDTFINTENLLYANNFVTVIKKGINYFRANSNYIKNKIDSHIKNMRIKLHHGSSYDCLQKIKKYKPKFIKPEIIKLQPCQINLY